MSLVEKPEYNFKKIECIPIITYYDCYYYIISVCVVLKSR